MLQKRIFKVLPAWLLMLLLVGSAAAAFVWISNIRITWVNVLEYPITLTGNFDNSTYQSETVYQEFYFAVNDASNSTGYVLIQFTTSGSMDTLSPGDIEVDIVLTWGSMFEDGYDMLGYPTSTAVNQLTFLFGDYLGDPFDFDMWGSTGSIMVYVTYNIAYYDIAAGIRITSTSS